MARSARAPAVVLVASLFAASPAAAATVAVSVDPGNTNFAGIVYRAGAGEANRLTLTFIEQFRTIRVVDTGAVVVSGSGCSSIDPNTAECTITDMPGVRAAARRRRAGSGPRRHRGEHRAWPRRRRWPGRRLAARHEQHRRHAEPRRRARHARGRQQQRHAHRRRQHGAADADILDGRGGRRHASATPLAPRRCGSTSPIPLRTASAGRTTCCARWNASAAARRATGSEGRLASDSLDGLGGEDRIFGRAGTDFISGGAGDDELTGGDGPDTISGNSGADVLRGRAGNDFLDGRRGGPDVVSCGRGGDDTTLGPNRRDFTARDCEAASFRFGAGGREHRARSASEPPRAWVGHVHPQVPAVGGARRTPDRDVGLDRSARRGGPTARPRDDS